MDIIKDEDFESVLGHFRSDFRNLSFKERQANVNMSHRERERRMRENLKSQHGPTAEEHDQVSWIFDVIEA